MTDTDLVTAGDSTENDKLSNPVTPETSSENDAHSNASDGSLATMVLPELRALANRSGVKGTSECAKANSVNFRSARIFPRGIARRRHASHPAYLTAPK